MKAGRDRFLELVLQNHNNRVILERAERLGLPDWWRTSGALFQTVRNGLKGYPADHGICDDDLFYFDGADLSAQAEAQVGVAVSTLSEDLGVAVDACREARVHLWYAEESGVPAQRFESSRDAVDHFAATTCCFAITRLGDGTLDVYAPHGFEDLLARRLRPNPVLAPRHVYEAKARRWSAIWPSLLVERRPE